MTAIALVQKVKNLPTVSHAALKLISLLDKPSVDNEEIVQIIKYDNVLTAKLLRACNAPSFGLGESVSSVDQAVLILGHTQIFHIVMTLAFGSVMTVSSLSYTIEMNELWEHSLVTAMASQIVLDGVPELSAETNVAFTANLLHDIGKMVLAQTVKLEELAEIRDRISRKLISGVDAEKEVLGLDHAEVGAALLQSWRLPENIVEAVGNHHRPVFKSRPPLSVVVHIANAVAHRAKPPPGQSVHDTNITEAVATALKIKEENVAKMAEEFSKSAEQMDRFMAMV
jgi:putative nucleotidyltransferase with HDIG domain